MSGVLYVPYTPLIIPPCAAFPNGETRDYPLVPVALYYQNRVIDFLAVIDSGADHCVFPAIYGQQVGIPVLDGKKAMAAGSTGTGDTYYHQVHVGIEIEGKPYGFDCYAGFMPGLDGMGVGLLGRCGFFDLFAKVAFNTKERVVELTPRE